MAPMAAKTSLEKVKGFTEVWGSLLAALASIPQTWLETPPATFDAIQ